MKTCPICNAAAFDDAAICYGCLHRFDEGDLPPSVATVGLDGPGGAPTLVISVRAVKGDGDAAEWRCDVDGRTFAVPLVH